MAIDKELSEILNEMQREDNAGIDWKKIKEEKIRFDEYLDLMPDKFEFEKEFISSSNSESTCIDNTEEKQN